MKLWESNNQGAERMKKGRYILEIDDDGEDVTVEVIGGISVEEIIQVFGFCTSYLIEQGADVEELKSIIDTSKGSAAYKED